MLSTVTNIPYAAFSSVRNFYNELNAATLTGAIDVVVVEQEDGSLQASPFHVRFGKLGVLRSREKVVEIFINGELVDDVRMKLGEDGEAFFVEPILATSAPTTTTLEPSSAAAALRTLRKIRRSKSTERIALTTPTAAPIAIPVGSPAESTKSNPVESANRQHRFFWSIRRSRNAAVANGSVASSEPANNESSSPSHGSPDAPTPTSNSNNVTGLYLSQIQDLSADEFDKVLGTSRDRATSASPAPRMHAPDTISPLTVDDNSHSSEPANAFDAFIHQNGATSKDSGVVSDSESTSRDNINLSILAGPPVAWGSLDNLRHGFDEDAQLSFGPSAEDAMSVADEALQVSVAKKEVPIPIVAPDSDEEMRDAQAAGITYGRTLRMQNEQLQKLRLKPGRNEVEFVVVTRYQGTATARCHIYLWRYDERIVVSDIDGTITISDVLGHIMPIMGAQWAQAGIVSLYSRIKHNGYQLLYLSSRAVGQSRQTRYYLSRIRQENCILPEGPLMLSPTSLFAAFHLEVIEKRPEQFKTQCLRDIRSLFPPTRNPFWAGYGNRINDFIAYRAAGVPPQRVFIVNHLGELRQETLYTNVSSYTGQMDIIDAMFPPVVRDDEDCFRPQGHGYRRMQRNFSVQSTASGMSQNQREQSATDHTTYSTFNYWDNMMLSGAAAFDVENDPLFKEIQAEQQQAAAAAVRPGRMHFIRRRTATTSSAQVQLTPKQASAANEAAAAMSDIVGIPVMAPAAVDQRELEKQLAENDKLEASDILKPIAAAATALVSGVLPTSVGTLSPDAATSTTREHTSDAEKVLSDAVAVGSMAGTS